MLLEVRLRRFLGKGRLSKGLALMEYVGLVAFVSVVVAGTVHELWGNFSRDFMRDVETLDRVLHETSELSRNNTPERNTEGGYQPGDEDSEAGNAQTPEDDQSLDEGLDEGGGNGSGPGGNNGHGNDADGNDDSNPGNSNDPDDHSDDDGEAGKGRGPGGNNGHGNDADGNDDSNPGASNDADDDTDDDGSPGRGPGKLKR